jgi:Tfp pilus assembly protein PilF
MKLYSLGCFKTILSCSLVAALSHAAPAGAQEVRLFPAGKPHTNIPKQLPPISAAASESETMPVESASMGGGQPLRVVIPNIKQRKTFPGKASIAQAPVPPQKSIAEALYAGAQDVWNNGVVLADKGQNFLIRTMFKPNLPFATLPLQWQVASVPPPESVTLNIQAIANLEPAAGGEPSIIQPMNKAPDMAPTKASAENASEPAPTLSTQSKNIAAKIPPVADSKPKETPRKVDISHGREVTGDVLNSSAAPNDAAGVKVGNARAKFDVNYELERAYNALLAGKSDSAIPIYEDILTGDPKNKEALFGLASTYHRAGQIDKARALYGKLLEIEPKHRDGLNNFLVLLADEAPQEALAQMEQLEGQNPGFSPIPAQMAIIYQKLGDQDKAVDKMYRALSIAPENITYRYNLAIMLDRSGKFGEAGQLYSQILDAHAKGEVIPGDAAKIQQRLTFIRSNIRS